LNTYGYVGGNPLNRFDPLGLWYNSRLEHGVDPNVAMALPKIPGPFGPLCGPEGSPGALWIPDVNKRACKRHDECYEDCALECKPKSCKLKCDLELGFKVPLYGLATALGGDTVYKDLKEEYGCNATCGK